MDTQKRRSQRMACKSCVRYGTYAATLFFCTKVMLNTMPPIWFDGDQKQN